MNRLKKITEQLQPQNTSSEAEEYLGVHTCVPALIGMPYVHKFLHGNYKLPPYVICTGNGERVRDCLKYLDDAVLFQDVMRSFKLNPYRIEIAVGLYKGTPITIFEHQIGSGSTEIYLKELLSDKCMTNIYKVSSSHSANKCFTSDSKYLIRLGTSLGINSRAKQAVHFNPGDISISTHQVGISSTDFQAMTSNLNIFNAQASLAKATKLLEKMGYKMKTITDNKNASETWPVVAFDKELHETLTQRVTANYKTVNSKYKCVSSLGNVSKDSLYSEEAPDTFIRLRKHCDVGTSDMEAATIIRTTRQMGIDHANKIKVGYCSIILGVLGPNGGDSFVSFDRYVCNQVQWISALEALHQISQKHIN
eukprot:545717_1